MNSRIRQAGQTQVRGSVVQVEGGDGTRCITLPVGSVGTQMIEYDLSE